MMSDCAYAPSQCQIIYSTGAHTRHLPTLIKKKAAVTCTEIFLCCEVLVVICGTWLCVLIQQLSEHSDFH